MEEKPRDDSENTFDEIKNTESEGVLLRNERLGLFVGISSTKVSADRLVRTAFKTLKKMLKLSPPKIPTGIN